MPKKKNKTVKKEIKTSDDRPKRGGTHPKHPPCPECGKAMYKTMEVGKAVRKSDPWSFCRNKSCSLFGVDQFQHSVEEPKEEESDLDKKIKEAVDNIFGTGDYKMDAEMAAESLVELNPKAFDNMLYEDLPDNVRSEIYGAVINPVQQNALMVSRMKKASKPTKTLESIKETGTIDISDPNVADEFARFMKETDPEGSKKLEQTVELANFDPKGRKKNATGGRAGFKMGRRAFLKLMGGVGAGIGAAKTGLLKLAGKEPAKQVAKEFMQQSTTTPPPYFFKLAEKIKMLGDDATATTDRTIAKTLKSKDGKSTYVLEEDVTSGDTIIKKINKEGDEMMTDVEIMELKKGEVVMGKDGRPVKVPDEYEEVTEANARIEGDAFNDPYYSDGIEIDDILREVDDIPVPKASGGIARMLGE